MNIMSYGVVINEEDLENEVIKYLKKIKPNILVITGHDAKIEKNKYKNSKYFINAIKKAREYERSIEKLIIVAGACQSDYEELIKAGANFASSPKRINIHALDPAIIASRMSLSDSNVEIDLKDIIENTKYGSNGIGGIITKGTMYRGYPR
jgi:spore coat assembly protein